MDFSEKHENAVGDAGIFTIDHPVIKYPVQIASDAVLPAGTILKKSASGGTYEAAAPSDTPAAVLIEASSADNKLPMAGFHGVAVRERLVDASGANPASAGDTLAGKLPEIGIWLSQTYEAEVK